MKNFRLPRVVLIVYLISWSYWLYLAFSSISSDLIGYKELGGILYHQGLMGYVATGLHREPLYPFLCSLAMSIENLSGITFMHIMAGFSILILMATQILMYVIQRELKIRTWICCLILLYFAVSPAITNSAFNILLFCEIVTYPLILAVVLAGYYGWEAVKQNNKIKALGYGALSGFIFATLTFVKAAFECICPAYFFVFLAAFLFKNKISVSLVCFLTAAGVLFYFPVLGYKCLNKTYNGNFAIADRGPINLYGNVARRIEPLTIRSYLADLASVAGVCEKYFKPQECYFWSYLESDGVGGQKSYELTNLHLSPQAVTDNLLRLSKEGALNHLPQYALLTATEGLKAFFWEASTSFILLRFIMAVVTCFALFYCCFFLRHLPDMMKYVLALIFLFVVFYSLFAILPRHILPMVPLYLISIGYWLHVVLPEKKMENNYP